MKIINHNNVDIHLLEDVHKLPINYHTGGVDDKDDAANEKTQRKPQIALNFVLWWIPYMVDFGHIALCEAIY